MKIAMIGGGVVDQTLAAKLIANGHDVTIGIRKASAEELARPRNFAETLKQWQARTGGAIARAAPRFQTFPGGA